MDVYLVDGTYELFRHYFAVPSHVTREGREVAAVRGVVGSILGMIESGTTHLAVATDKVIESFRNDMWPGYKTSAGMDPVLLQQFPLLEEALEAMGVSVWAMVEFEADDALGAGAARAAEESRVGRVYICSPDKDLGQCVRGSRVVQLDRRKRLVTDEAGVIEKFGVGPASIPDYLGLVGDSSDGYPGLPGWGAKSAAAVLARWQHLESVPADCADWDVELRGRERLCAALAQGRELAYLFRDIATIRTDIPLFGSIDELRWTGPRSDFPGIAAYLEWSDLTARTERAAARAVASPG